VVVFVVVLTLLLLSPLTAFSGRLLRARNWGVIEHGAMSCSLARRVESEYLHAARERAEPPLFELIQAHADATTSGEVVTRTSPLLVTRGYLILFVSAALLPLLFATLAELPFSQVFGQLVRLLAR
jgi:hypothetical protein